VTPFAPYLASTDPFGTSCVDAAWPGYRPGGAWQKSPPQADRAQCLPNTTKEYAPRCKTPPNDFTVRSPLPRTACLGPRRVSMRLCRRRAPPDDSRCRLRTSDVPTDSRRGNVIRPRQHGRNGQQRQ